MLCWPAMESFEQPQGLVSYQAFLNSWPLSVHSNLCIEMCWRCGLWRSLDQINAPFGSTGFPYISRGLWSGPGSEVNSMQPPKQERNPTQEDMFSWSVPIRKFKEKDRQVLSPSFFISLGQNQGADFKIILRATSVCSDSCPVKVS